MSDLIVPAAVIAVLVLGVVVLLGGLLMRRTIIGRGVGAFDCSLRYRPQTDGWMFGLARYEQDRIDWFRLFALTFRPSRTLARSNLTILERRHPEGTDQGMLDNDWVLVRCAYDSTTLELGMSEMAYNGLATWLESAPPGEHANIA